MAFKYQSLYYISAILYIFMGCSIASANICEVCHPKKETCCVSQCKTKERRAFLKFITGASFSQKAHISADPAVWDPAPEGYNSDLGNAPIVGAGFGYKFCDFLSSDLSVTHRWDYKYSKFQSTPPNAGTPQALPAKTRRFDLNSTSVMFGSRLHGRGIRGFSYNICNPDTYIAPFLGAGIGFTYHKVRNFHSRIAPTALTSGLSGVSSIGTSPSSRTSFTYQLEAGVEYIHQGTWGFTAGYRWFDAGKFKTPSSILAGTGLPGNPIVGVAVPPWTGKLRAHEIFVELAYHF